MISEIQIAHRKVGPEHEPFIIAEMSGNHNQSLDRALQIVDAAAESGAHALKLQTYTAETMTLDLKEGDFFIHNPNSLWKGKSLFELYEMAHTPWDWHGPIMERCKKKGLICFSSPFDATAVDFLEDLEVPAYKIASFENTDLRLIQKVASTGKPLIISTGMASLAELEEAVSTARNAGCRDLILLKCTSAYPAQPTDAHIRTIAHMRDLFQVQIGLSDHTPGIGVPIASVALGATLIEKHFTTSRAEGGVDSEFSLEPHELRSLVVETKRAWQALGEIQYQRPSEEKNSIQFRRSLYVSEDIQAGEKFSEKNIRAIRPGHGLPVKYLDQFLGKEAKRTIKRGTPLHWDLI